MVEPAMTTGTSGGYEYLIDAKPPADQHLTNNALVVWRVSDSRSNPALERSTMTTQEAYSAPPDAQQEGSTNPKIDTLDNRLMNAAFGNGALWTAQASVVDVNCAGSGSCQSEVRTYAIDPTATTPAILEYQKHSQAGRYRFNPAIMPNAAGTTVSLTMTRSSTAEYPGMFDAQRQAGTWVDDTAPVAAGVGPLTKTSGDTGCGTTCRWGDYAGASLDPSDSSTWLYNEVPIAGGVWGTFVADIAN